MPTIRGEIVTDGEYVDGEGILLTESGGRSFGCRVKPLQTRESRRSELILAGGDLWAGK